MTTIEFDKKVKCNGKYVAVRLIDNLNDLKIGNIFLTSNANANSRLAHGIIEDVGEIAAKEYGLEVGQYVMYDRLATFFHTAPVSLLEYNNVICITNKDQTEYHPLKGMMFIKPENTEKVSNVGGVYVQNYADKLNIGTIIDSNFTDNVKDDFKVGDKVLLVRGADVVQFGTTEILIYKEDMLICSIKD